MSDQFISDFLSKKNISELRQLMASEKPSFDDLRQLVTALEKSDAIEHTKLLLILVPEQITLENQQLQLTHRLNQILLAHACQINESEEITNRLKELKSFLNEDETVGYQVLEELLRWIEQSRTAEEIKAVLRLLPPAMCEKFYQRLLETATGQKNWASPLIQFVLSCANQSGNSQHLEALARCLILSPIHCDTQQLKSLSLLLSTPQLIDVTFRLRAIASTYTRQNAHGNSSALKHIFLNHYEELLMCVTIRATASESDYQELTGHNAELANLLMCKRLKLLDSVDEQRQLIIKLLENCAQFNWQDRQFHAFILEQIVNVLQTLSKDQTALCFSHYYDYHHTRNYYAAIRLLDALFEKKADDEVILLCLKRRNDEDNAFIINYLTASQTRDNKLLRGCLDILDISQLLNFCGPLTALAHLYRHEQPYFLKIYWEVLISKILSAKTATPYFPALIAATPDQALDEMIDRVFAELKNHPQLTFEWLVALLESRVDKSKLMPCCRSMLNEGIYATQKLDILKQFSCKELFDFYLYLVRHQAREDEFAGFVELFKETDRQTILLYILSNTPLISQAFLGKLLDSIDTKNIIYLIESLVDLARDDAEYNTTLEQLLLHFCSRLQLTYEDKDPVHHWTLCANSSLIAQQLLLSPVCFYSLCSRSSYLQDYTPSLLQSIVCKDISTDLKLRIARVLDVARLDDKSADAIALNLLSHFRENPVTLHYLFNNLTLVEPYLSENGKKNYQCIKASCWSLLKTKEPENTVYDETQVKTLLSSQLTAPHRFDGVLTTLANNLTSNHDVHLSALYLTQVEPKNFDKINPDVVVSVLLHSMEDKTKDNWKKAGHYLQDQTPEKAAAFVKRLVIQLKKIKNNPLLINQGLQFICQLPPFENLLLLFDDDVLQWLVRESHDEFLKANLCQWLEKLNEKGRLPNIALGALLALLPANPPLLNTVLQQKCLAPYLPSMFIEWTRHDHCDAHCISLYQQMNKLSPSEKRKAIDYIQHHLGQSGHRLSVAAPILTMLILDLPDIQFHHLSDRTCIIEQLKLFNQWANHNKDNNPHFLKEIESQLFNIIHFLSERDIQWTAWILGDQAFAHLALSCLVGIEAKIIDRHPFTTLLLDHMTFPLHPELTKSPIFKNYIRQLLLNPPASMQEDQFTLLFDKLGAEEGRQLALGLLKRPTLEEVQWSALLTLSRALSVEELFEIYQKSKTRFVFVDLIVRHQQGISRLNQEQKKSLLAHLDSGKQLLRILDSQTAVNSKFDFVSALFEYLDYTHTPLETWLNQLNVDGKTLAALANYTDHKKHPTRLREFIENNPYRQHEIKQYLQHPALDMPLNPAGILYDWVKTTWLHPERGNQCHPSFLKALDLGSLKIALQVQYRFLSQREEFPIFFEPFATSQHVAAETLVAARWLHRLPLLNDGLLEIAHYFTQCEDEKIKAAIRNTSLCKKLIQPLLLDGMPLQELFEIQLNELHALLKEYLTVPFPPDNQHRKWVKSVLHLYDFSLKSMEYSVPITIHSLFLPGCHSAKIVKGSISKLHPEIIDQLVNTEPKPVSAASMSTLLTACVSNPLLLKDKEIQTWLLDVFLFSSLGRHSIDTVLLNTLISGFDICELAGKMRERQQQMTRYQDCFRFLKELHKETSLSDVVKVLLKQKQAILGLFLEACEFANLPHLTSIMLLVLQVKRLALTPERIDAVLPPPLIHVQVLEWLQHDLGKMKNLPSQWAEQHHCIELEGFRYRADNKNNARLEELANASLRQTSPVYFYQVLNSYHAVFEKHDDEASRAGFTKVLSRLLNEERDPAMMIANLSPRLLELVIQYALDQGHSLLLEQLALHGRAQQCQQMANTTLRQKLFEMFKSNPSPERLDALSLEQWSQIPPSQLDALLRIQRLLFLIEPTSELVAWRKQHSDIKHRARACFSADASLFKLLTHLEQEAQRLYAHKPLPSEAEENLTAAFRFLKQENNSVAYLSMDNFPQNSQFSEAAVNSHYYGLFAFLSETPEALVDGFIEWLAALKPETLNKQGQLIKLLHTLSSKQLLNVLSQRLAIKPLNTIQMSWIYSQLKSLPISHDQLVSVATTAFEWNWLTEEIKTAPLPDSLRLLKAAVHTKNHEAAIIATAQSQQAFLKLLAGCRFPPNELVHLLKTLTSRPLRSLLAIHLLGRMDYLEKLSGQSLLTQFNTPPSMLLPRRLQSLTQSIEASMLTPDLLSQFTEESAANLFCSPLHFHGLDKLTTTLLLKRVGHSQRDHLIRYWLNHCANLPNSTVPLLALTNGFTRQVQTIISDMEPLKRRPLLMAMIEQHHQLSESGTLNNLLTHCDETHLTHALQLYLHGRRDMQSLIDLIKNLLNAMDLQKLSSPTVQLLIRVTEDSHFTDLQARLSPATRDYLRQNALNGHCAVFYDDGILSMQRLRKPLIDPREGNDQPHGFLSFLFPSTNTAPLKPRSHEPPVVDQLKEEFDTILSLHYFLIHYRGEADALKQLMNDYLRCCGHEKSAPTLQAVAWLINQPSVKASTRKILFESFWKFPAVMDAQIASCLLQYDAIQVVKGLGLQKKYQELSTLCNQALPYLDSDSETATIVRTAGREADFENTLSKTSSFLREWRIWFRRCFFYGWSGWFVPKKPQFVTPFEEKAAHSGRLFPDMSGDKKEASSTRARSLPELLQLLQRDASLDELEALEKALEIYEWQEQKPNEREVREKTDLVFSELLQRARGNDLSTWLSQHKDIFIKNRKSLLGLYSRANDEDALRKRLQQAEMELPLFKSMADELLTAAVPPSIEASSMVPTDKKSDDAGIVNQFTTTVTAAMGALPRLRFWGQRTVIESTQPINSTMSVV